MEDWHNFKTQRQVRSAFLVAHIRQRTHAVIVKRERSADESSGDEDDSDESEEE